MTINRQTLIVIGASTALGYLGDALTFSIADSKGKDFKWTWPTGKAALQILAAGIIGGFILDWGVQKIQRWAMSDEEKALADIYAKEVELIQSGQRAGVMPAITWSAKTA